MGKHDADYAACVACGSLHVVAPHWLDEAYLSPAKADQLDSGAPWRNEVLARATMEIGKLAPVGAWLDYGCGQGLLLAKLRGKGRMIDGYDPYRGMHIDEKARYSLITAYEVLEHQTAPLDFVSKIQQRLNSDGILILSTCLREPRHGENWNYLALKSGQHVSFPSASGMAALASNVGLNWWATGVCRENSDLQIHVLSTCPTSSEISSILNLIGFAVLAKPL